MNGHIAEFHLIPPIAAQFPYRHLQQPSIPDGKLPGDGHLPHEVKPRNALVRSFPALHPTNQDAAAIQRFQRLRRIKVKAIIHRTGYFRVKVLFCICRPNVIHGTSTIMEFHCLRPHFQCTVNQHIPAIQMKIVRAFPHGSKTVSTGIQDAVAYPTKSIPALKKQDIPAAVFAPVHRNCIINAVFHPDFGVPEILGAGTFREAFSRYYRIPLIFFIVQAIPNGDALCLCCPVDTGVKEEMTAIRHFQCAPGKAAIFIIVVLRCQRRRKELPPDEIRRFRMTPVHRTPLGVVGVVLKKQVIFPTIGRKAIGVVYPAYASRQMIYWKLGLYLGTMQCFIVPRFLQLCHSTLLYRCVLRLLIVTIYNTEKYYCQCPPSENFMRRNISDFHRK